MTTTLDATLPCAVCAGQSKQEPVLEGLHRCRDCGFIAYRRYDPGSLSRLYEESFFAGAEYPDYIGQQGALRRSMRRHLRQMARYSELRGSLLEVGCAYGLFLDEARARFSRVVGIDICDEPVEYARAQLGLDARVADFTTADFGGQRFDAVCMWDTIEHVPAPDRFLERAAAVLTGRGTLFLTTADIGALNARLRGARWRQIRPPVHLNYFSRATITRLCRRVGLEVVGIETAGYYHTAFNILGTLRLRGGGSGRLARLALQALGERRARAIGGWVNLGDIMFVAARPVQSGA